MTRYCHTLPEWLWIVLPEVLSESAAGCTSCVLPALRKFRFTDDMVMIMVFFAPQGDRSSQVWISCVLEHRHPSDQESYVTMIMVGKKQRS